jgi:hypothetical protein
MANSRSVCRFAVGSPNGPRSAVWRVWSGNDGSVYLAARAVANQLKVSLHPKERQSGLTKGYHAKLRARGEAQGSARKVWYAGVQIQPPSFTLEFRLFFPTSHLEIFSSRDANDPLVTWIPSAPEATALHVAVILGPDVAKQRLVALSPDGSSIEAEVLAQWSLADNRRVWLAHHCVPEGAFQNRAAAGNAIRDAARKLGITFRPGHRAFLDFDGPDGVRGVCEYAAALC